MKHAYIFPGQGSQFPGMGKNLYGQYASAREWFEKANDILGFHISDILFEGAESDLRQTKVTQPAVFIHSVIAFRMLPDAKPDMVAGHSLGEFSALVAADVLTFEAALRLVSVRAQSMQKACEHQPSAMAAVLSLEDKKVEEICADVWRETGEVVVPANYNCPGQLVISGSIKGVDIACERLKAAGAKRALVLPVGGAFHSPLMAPAKAELSAAILATEFRIPTCPIYQNVVAEAVTDPSLIRQNLVEQLTGAVRWTQSVEAMIRDGASHFTEVGPGKVLQGLVTKIDKTAVTDGFQ
jgi:[acyl-carrier-protein] S-malonyltransferase